MPRSVTNAQPAPEPLDAGDPRADVTAPPPTPAKAPRDWLVDVLRVASMCVVVLMHWTLMRVTMSGGKVTMVNSLHGPVAVAATWVLQVMPLFFICGGFANTVTFDKVAREGGGYGAFVGLRARRLLTPVLPLVAFVLLVVLVLSQVGMRAIGDIVADQAANILWFLSAYLTCVAVTPLLVRLHDRVGWWAPLAMLAAGLLAVDAVRYGAGREAVATANIYLVWLFCHQLGVLYARRTLRGLGTPVLLGIVAAGVAALVAMVLAGPYADVNLGLADHPVQNLQPANAVIAVLGVIQLALMTMTSRRLEGWEPGRRLKGLVTRLNLLLMVIFLWHIPASFLAIGVGMLAPGVLLPTDEPTWWALRPVWYVMELAFLAVFVLLAMRWELFCHGFAARKATVPVTLGVLAGIVGVFLVWRNGLGITVRGENRPDWASISGELLIVTAIALTAVHSETVHSHPARCSHPRPLPCGGPATRYRDENTP